MRRLPRASRLSSDERLVALVRAEDPAAFDAIFDRYHRMLLSFCRHMLGSREESEDAVQQTFLSAYNSLRRSSQPIVLRPWLFAIARNRCLNHIRQRREEPAGNDIEVATEGLADEVQRRDDLKALLRDLRDLPEDQRAAIVLAQIGALGHREIADVIEVPEAKIKALIFQARRSLIASRVARDTPCAEIREQLAVAEGSALRRGPLRRHLSTCDGCREWKAQVRRQKAALALVLPVVPTPGLKAAVSLATGAGGSGGAAGGAALGGVVSATAKSGFVIKALVVAAVAGTGAAGTVAVVDHATHHRHSIAAGSHPGASGAGPPRPGRSSRAAHRHVPGPDRLARGRATPLSVLPATSSSRRDSKSPPVAGDIRGGARTSSAAPLTPGSRSGKRAPEVLVPLRETDASPARRPRPRGRARKRVVERIRRPDTVP